MTTPLPPWGVVEEVQNNRSPSGCWEGSEPRLHLHGQLGGGGPGRAPLVPKKTSGWTSPGAAPWASSFPGQMKMIFVKCVRRILNSVFVGEFSKKKWVAGPTSLVLVLGGLAWYFGGKSLHFLDFIFGEVNRLSSGPVTCWGHLVDLKSTKSGGFQK